jgi:hypothetical protein
VGLSDNGSPAYQTASVGGTAVRVWSGTFTALAGISPAVTVRDITIINTGSYTCYVGGSSVTNVGLPLPPGAQLTVQGWSALSGTTTNDIFAVTASGATATSTVAGLATNAAVT